MSVQATVAAEETRRCERCSGGSHGKRGSRRKRIDHRPTRHARIAAERHAVRHGRIIAGIIAAVAAAGGARIVAQYAFEVFTLVSAEVVARRWL